MATTGASTARGAPLASHWAAHLAAATSSSPGRPEAEQVQSPVLEIALEQPLQRQQGGQGQGRKRRARRHRRQLLGRWSFGQGQQGGQPDM